VHCFGVSRFMLEQNQVIELLSQHGSGFVERVRVVEVRRKGAASPFQNLADQKEIFFLIAH
jgi:hypothetical protein